MAFLNFLDILGRLERQVADLTAPIVSNQKIPKQIAAKKDAANDIFAIYIQISDVFERTSNKELATVLNYDGEVPEKDNLSAKFYLLDQWLKKRKDDGFRNPSTPLSDLAQQILNYNVDNLGGPGERVKKIAEVLSASSLDDPVVSSRTIIKGPRWGEDGNPITASALEAAENQATRDIRDVFSGGTQAGSAHLDRLADLALDYLDELKNSMDPRKEGSLVATVLGKDSGDEKISTFSPDSVFGKFNLDNHVRLIRGNYERDAVVGAVTHTVKTKLWTGINTVFGLAPNLQIMKRFKQWASFKDSDYTDLRKALKRSNRAADRCHRRVHNLSGRLVFQLAEQLPRPAFLELVRRIAARLENDPRFEGSSFDLQGCLKAVSGSFAVPGYESYFAQHLANFFCVSDFEKVTSKLLSVFEPEQAVTLRETYMMEKDAKGRLTSKPPSLYGMMCILDRAWDNQLAAAKEGLLPVPRTSPNTKLDAEYLAQNLSEIDDEYAKSKIGAIREQMERPQAVGEFSWKRMNPDIRGFLNNATPALNILTHPFFATWAFFKKIPLVSLPLHIVEGLHGFAGGALSLVGSGFGLIQPAKNAIEFAWSLTSPKNLRNIANHSMGQFHAVNASSGLLARTLTPYNSLTQAMSQFVKAENPECINMKSALVNLRNVTAHLHGFVIDAAKAARCGVGLTPSVANRFGMPNLKMKTITEINGAQTDIVDPNQYIHPREFITHLKKQLRLFYEATYGTGGETYFQVPETYPYQQNPFRLDNHPFGQYIKKHNPETGKLETGIIYSDTYKGRDDSGKEVIINQDETKLERKALARSLNKRDYEKVLKENQSFAQSENGRVRRELAEFNSYINAMTYQLEIFEGILTEAAKFGQTNTTEVRAGIRGLSMRPTPVNTKPSHKETPERLKPPLVTKTEEFSYDGELVPIDVILDGPIPNQAPGRHGATPLMISSPNFTPMDEWLSHIDDGDKWLSHIDKGLVH